MTLISTITISTPVGAVSIASIPTTFTDLYITVSARISGSFPYTDFYFNPNTDGSNIYTWRNLRGNGSSASSSVGSPSTGFVIVNGVPGALATSNTFGSINIYMPNYRSSTAKSISADAVTENNATDSSQNISAGLYNSTNPITDVYFSSAGANFVAGSTFSLYGITKGSGGATVS
jgi:hypothetical protein